MNQIISFREITSAVRHLFFPHICSGCGSDRVSEASELCLHCVAGLPETHFEKHPGNPVEKIFRGRLQLVSAAAQFYFTRESLMQRLMHQFKYKGNKELGYQLGRMMGDRLKATGLFHIDALIPLPLFPAKEKRRGFNQATVLCEAISEVMQVPVLQQVITRPQHTDSQTRKGRLERWKNIEGKFVLSGAEAVRNKHVLLVDDVITTGATMEACGSELLKAENIRLSVAALCISSR